MDAADTLQRLREICLAFPEVTEKLSHGAPTFMIRGKRVLTYFWDGHHGDEDMVALWCAAGPGVQEELVDTEPDRFFRPPYVGHRGWIGVRLDTDVDWDEIEAVLADAYRLVAPKSLVSELDGGSSEG